MADLVKEKGLSENRFSQYLVVIRGLNPKIKNTDVLKVGDNLFIPLRPDELLAAPAVSAKTDAQRSTVTKGAIKEYRVKQGEHLYQILREQLGIASDRDVALYYALVKDLNPERKNWDALLGGDLIRLPIAGKPVEVAVAERKVLQLNQQRQPQPLKKLIHLRVLGKSKKIGLPRRGFLISIMRNNCRPKKTSHYWASDVKSWEMKFDGTVRRP